QQRVAVHVAGLQQQAAPAGLEGLRQYVGLRPRRRFVLAHHELSSRVQARISLSRSFSTPVPVKSATPSMNRASLPSPTVPDSTVWRSCPARSLTVSGSDPSTSQTGRPVS